MGIADDDIERVRTTVPIFEVIQQHLQLRRVGRNWVGLCPFHPEKSPSFNVREETGRYKCFGCQAGGDVITFVREIEHLDFAGAVEWLAGRYNISLTYTTGGEGRDRQHRKRLVEAMDAASAWYHDRLLKAADAGPARAYLRSRGIDGDTARHFQIGWAPDAWDELARGLGQPADIMREAGLAFMNRAQRLQDTFRGRVLFPIRNENGEAVAFGGRVLPGSTDPAKYKNSPESPIYSKSRTLYGLSIAKTEIVAADQVVVCEGYTDVIGFHRAGVRRAVATCGTALTEEHVRLLKRFARKVVLAFDADAAGQGAAEKFYEWEKKHEIEVSVAKLPDGSDPADLAGRDAAALRRAVEQAVSFLGFRVDRVLRRGSVDTPEHRARTADVAMAVVNEHPDVNVRTIYAGQVASQVGLPVNDLVAIARRGKGQVRVPTATATTARNESAEVVVLALLVSRWDDMAPWLVPELFNDNLAAAAFDALGAAGGDVNAAIDGADAEVRELLERIAVMDVDAAPDVEAKNLIAAAARREIDRTVRQGHGATTDWMDAKRQIELLSDPVRGTESADALLAWLTHRTAGPDS